MEIHRYSTTLPVTSDWNVFALLQWPHPTSSHAYKLDLSPCRVCQCCCMLGGIVIAERDPVSHWQQWQALAP